MRAFLLMVLLAAPAAALEPKQIAVVSNSRVPASVAVAAFYAEKRGVPAGNLISLPLPTGEEMTRDEYDTQLAAPLRERLKDSKAEITCILTVFGVPIRAAGKTPSAAEKAELETVKVEIAAAEKKPDPAAVQRLKAKEILLSHAESTSAVDSELMLLWHPPYALARWQPNPLHWQFPAATRARLTAPTLLTARLDGPNPEIAKRLVTDAMAAEATGLVGNAYVDARGIAFDSKADNGYGYGGYDQSMRDAADHFKTAVLPTTLDDGPDLFKVDSCPNVALYCGWYSLAQYRRPGNFVPGAVAWHLASLEALTLRDANTKTWCVNLLKDGVAVTLGPVAEPYTVGFPKPAEFFGFLLTGTDTVAEVHAKTQLFTSWMTTLVGDPLYNPFRKTPRRKPADVFASPRGGQTLFR